MTTSAPVQQGEAGTPAGGSSAQDRRSGLLRTILTQRVILLAILLVLVVVGFSIVGAAGGLSGNYNSDYLASALINVVPLAMLGMAELVVIVSGRGGIDLSVGAIVSLTSMVFGFMYGQWGYPLALSIIIAVLFGALCGALNGVLTAYIGFPALISTLATFYAFKSLAIVVNEQQPISTPPIQDLYVTARSVELPLIGQFLPLFPLGLLIFLLPTAVLLWYLTAKSPYGRRLYAIGTNDTAADWSAINVAGTRFWAYVCSGAVAGLVAVVNVGQFASARPDAGTSGNGMALPAITIAVLGGVAITGGIGRVSGVILASLLVVWLNAGVLLAFSGNVGTQTQLLALGVLLIAAALLNGYTNRRFRVLQ